MSFFGVWFYFFVVFCTVKTRADFTDVDELVEQSEQLISSYEVYKDPSNNDAYFENMTSTEPLGKLNSPHLCLLICLFQNMGMVHGII